MNELPYPLFHVVQSSDSDNKSNSYTALNHSNWNSPHLFFLAYFFLLKYHFRLKFSIYMLSKLFLQFNTFT